MNDSSSFASPAPLSGSTTSMASPELAYRMSSTFGVPTFSNPCCAVSCFVGTFEVRPGAVMNDSSFVAVSANGEDQRPLK